MNSDIADLAKWAQENGWMVKDDAKGYTRFFDPNGDYVGRYPATPGNARRRMADLKTDLKRGGLEIPPPSKKELKARRNKESKEETS